MPMRVPAFLSRFLILAIPLAFLSACNPTPVPGDGYGVNELRPDAAKG
jgi:hypothetical protein